MTDPLGTEARTLDLKIKRATTSADEGGHWVHNAGAAQALKSSVLREEGKRSANEHGAQFRWAFADNVSTAENCFMFSAL